MRLLNQPLPAGSIWAISIAAAVGGAWVNHALSVRNDGRLTFMILYPAVLLAGYLGGAWPAVAAGLIGACALVLWHPEMTDGRTLSELGSVGLFLLICALIARVCQALHRANSLAHGEHKHSLANAEFPLQGPFAPWVVWPVSLLALGVALAINPEIAYYSSGRLPFMIFFPVMALAGYMGGFLPAFVTTLVGVGSVWIWHPHIGGLTGAPFYLLSGMYVFIGAVIGLLAEALVRERRRAAVGAAALRDLPEAQARFAAIAKTSPDALWIWDMNAGRLLFISPASEKLIGMTAAEVCAQTQAECAAQIHPEDYPTVDAAMTTLRTAATGETVEYEYRHQHRDGSWRWLRNRAGVFARNPDGTVAQVFGHTEDVTERHETVARLAEQAAELARIAVERETTLREREALLEAERAARAEAERANRLKDDFLATVSHELRTPLTAMLGWTAMLSEDATDPELRNGLEVISRNARAQRQLIEDLLDMSRIMTGKLRIDPQPVLLGDVVSTALETVQPAAEARGVALTSHTENCEEPIQADVARLQQVIWNLLSNAVKFTPAGGQVRIEAICAGDDAVISVTDTGQGMAAEFVPHVFERFRQEDGATTRKTGGLGLGLAIAKHLVELHGGTVSARSDGLGKGSVFTVTLPLHGTRAASRLSRTSAPGASASAAPLFTLPPDALAGRRLLVIDDEADTRSYLHRVLTDRGAQVAVAESAAEGLQRALKEKPDAVICDISMPGEDGYSFIRHLRRAEDGTAAALPVAALTALARGEDRQRALDAGFDEHCAKPVEPAELLALVARLLPGVER
jgi:PAS domain S-box-containing protein